MGNDNYVFILHWMKTYLGEIKKQTNATMQPSKNLKFKSICSNPQKSLIITPYATSTILHFDGPQFDYPFQDHSF